MRKLKFRGWCEGSYKYDIVVIDETNFMDCWDGWVFKGEVEQSTGIKDKNGKEIYEGDIVKRAEDGGFDIVGVVEWSEKAARFWVDRYYYPGGGKWEVIGNIHENRELLDE